MVFIEKTVATKRLLQGGGIRRLHANPPSLGEGRLKRKDSEHGKVSDRCGDGTVHWLFAV